LIAHQKREVKVNRDPFGNLHYWKTVLDQLDDIETKGVVAEYQRAFIRVLKFKKNWQLRETVL
jgi:hypothetical protein